MNSILKSFIVDNWFGAILFVLSLIPIIPQKLVDPFGNSMNEKLGWPSEPLSIVRVFVKQILKLFSDLAVILGLQGSVSVLLFVVVGTDLYFNHVTSPSTVIVIIVAVIALYLDFMIKNAEEIEFFRVFKYKSKPSLSNPPNQS